MHFYGILGQIHRVHTKKCPGEADFGQNDLSKVVILMGNWVQIWVILEDREFKNNGKLKKIALDCVTKEGRK